MSRTTPWSYQSFLYLAAALVILAVLLRSLLIYASIPAVLDHDLLLLAAWLFLFVSQPSMTRRWPGYFPIYLATQSALIVGMLSSYTAADHFAFLFAVLSMQAVQRFSPRLAAVYIVLSAGLTALPLARLAGPLGALVLSLSYATSSILFGYFALATRRAAEAQGRNRAMLQELEGTNGQLQAYARQLEQMMAVRERNRLARELHDSVTQTVFSMTLTIQSALLLLDRDPARVSSQLDHLNDLARSALAEIQTLIAELRPESADTTGLVPALRRHLAGRPLADGLSVSLEVDGDRPLDTAEEQGLFRIAQEALNNVVKHARASRACLHLHLTEPLWMEIQDDGQGFDPEQVRRYGGMGLSNMRERAAEIGWDLQVLTAPGAGTRVRVEKGGGDARQREDHRPDRGRPPGRPPGPADVPGTA